jgi:aminoglycoside 6-adenylyltransferase
VRSSSAGELLARIVEWAETNANVIALIMTGSRARGDSAFVDEFSDFDLEIIAENAAELADNDEWLRSFGPIMVCLPLSEGQAHPTRLVFYEGGLKVDFSLCTRERLMAMVDRLNGLYQRGYRVLVDKEGVTAGLPAATGAAPSKRLPSQQVFSATVNEFWFEAAHIPRYLLRNEPWVVKIRDWTMKELLLRMLEWHAVALSGRPLDVWHIGTHMKDWVDSQTWQELQAVFSRFDRDDSWRGLLAMTALFRRLARETASATGLEYLATVDENVSGYLAGFENKL